MPGLSWHGGAGYHPPPQKSSRVTSGSPWTLSRTWPQDAKCSLNLDSRCLEDNMGVIKIEGECCGSSSCRSQRWPTMPKPGARKAGSGKSETEPQTEGDPVCEDAGPVWSCTTIRGNVPAPGRPSRTHASMPIQIGHSNCCTS